MKRLRGLLRRDPGFFWLTIVFIGFCFVTTGITWLNFRDPPLLIATAGFGGLGVFVFWLRDGGPRDQKPKR